MTQGVKNRLDPAKTSSKTHDWTRLDEFWAQKPTIGTRKWPNFELKNPLLGTTRWWSFPGPGVGQEDGRGRISKKRTGNTEEKIYSRRSNNEALFELIDTAVEQNVTFACFPVYARRLLARR
ncbi:hypothetical protein B0H19DRAFT_1083655 [Mycena capillaripes]|nr:hypothetical protein B0H19DRAFT_1083655 [Mycena capillaripes]